jgi:DNA modification methylase
MADKKIIKAKIDQLIPDDVNFNKGTEYGQSLIEKSLRQFGAGRSILLDKNNRIIAGNKTVENAGQIGLDKVLIVETTGEEIVAVKRTDIDLDTKEGRELALADNATGAANLDWDEVALSEATETWGIDSEGWGVPIELGEEEPENELSEDGFNPPAEVDIETDIKEGDIFEIRNGDICHRVMCGDSTSLIDVAKLMGGRLADIIVTDPPYNVDYAGKNEHLNKTDRGNRIQTDIENDNMNDAQFKNFLESVYARMFDSSKPGAGIYVFHASREAVNFINGLIGAGFLYKQQLIWVKNNIVIGRQDYQWIHEPILYGWKDGGPHYFVKDRTQRTVMEDKIDFDSMTKKELLAFIKEQQNDKEHPTTVIHEEKPLVNAEHPTMKPVKLVGRLIRNSSKVNDLVIDFFLGSGSTLIASHQLERNCYGLEISPKYCQVIIDRIKLFDPEVVVTKL